MGNTLEFRGISKWFPGVKALDKISFTAYAGEVMAFLGENGAGKSTLLKVLNGDYQPTEGMYLLGGKERHFKTPEEAIDAGVSVIYQERQILPELTVAENIYLGRMPTTRLGVIDKKKANEMAQRIIDDFGLPIRPMEEPWASGIPLVRLSTIRPMQMNMPTIILAAFSGMSAWLRCPRPALYAHTSILILMMLMSMQIWS